MQVSWKVIVIVVVLFFAISIGLGYWAASNAARAREYKSTIAELKARNAELESDYKRHDDTKQQAESDHKLASDKLGEYTEGARQYNVELSDISRNFGVSISSASAAVGQLKSNHTELDKLLKTIGERAQSL